jgi:hypothetical protein
MTESSPKLVSERTLARRVSEHLMDEGRGFLAKNVGHSGPTRIGKGGSERVWFRPGDYYIVDWNAEIGVTHAQHVADLEALARNEGVLRPDEVLKRD